MTLIAAQGRHAFCPIFTASFRASQNPIKGDLPLRRGLYHETAVLATSPGRILLRTREGGRQSRGAKA